MELTICQSEIFLNYLNKSCEYINMNMHFHRIASHIRILPARRETNFGHYLHLHSHHQFHISVKKFCAELTQFGRMNLCNNWKRNKNSNYYFYVKLKKIIQFLCCTNFNRFNFIIFFCCFIAKCHCKHLFNIFRFSNQSSPFSVKECWLLFKWGFW
jgi:hypothetical protein